jgi:hypothetical protein
MCAIRPQDIDETHLWILEIPTIETSERDVLHLIDAPAVRPEHQASVAGGATILIDQNHDMASPSPGLVSMPIDQEIPGQRVLEGNLAKAIASIQPGQCHGA